MRNEPGSLLNDGTKTRGKTECHFTIYEGITIVFVEVQLGVEGYENLRDAVAQVILECDGQASL
jgi:phage-related holin